MKSHIAVKIAFTEPNVETNEKTATTTLIYPIHPDPVHAAGCDAVLTTRVLSKGDGTVSQQQPSGDAPGFVYGASPLTTYGDFLKATLQANLYDAKTEELVWSTTFKTFDADRAAKVSRELGKFFFEALRKDGLI